MKKSIAVAIASALLAVTAYAVPFAKASNGSDEVILSDDACTLELAKSVMPPEVFTEAKNAMAVVGGHTYKACYVVEGDMIHLLYEDGDQGLVPQVAFKPLKTT